MRRIDGIYYQSPPITSAVQPVVVLSSPPVAKTSRLSRRRFFRLTLIGPIFLCLYFLIAPFYPNAVYFLHKPSLPNPVPPVVLGTNTLDSSADSPVSSTPLPTTHLLTIPKIGVESEILEGKNESTLDQGLWRRPSSSTPDKGSNTVITGHRFKYLSGKNTFYHLDKLVVGDTIEVRWDGKLYRYQVVSSKTVPADAFSIEEKSNQPILTLYTCTPLWTSTNRLVVIAALQA